MESQPRRTRVRPTRSQTRAQLLSAAGQVFAERGFERATLDDVAAAAGLTKGAVYSSFSGKDELFYALLQERIAERLEIATAAAGTGQTLDEIASAVGGGLRDLLSTQRDWQLLFIDFWAHAVRDPQLQHDFAAHRRRIREVLAGIIDRIALEVGATLALPSDALAVVVLSLANGFAIEQIADPETVDASILPLALQLLFQAATAEAETASETGAAKESLLKALGNQRLLW